ncbi:MAG TPA: HAMP domain-containing sensor histidine kinase [Acidimicrobiia bacterium]|nr:HAMP domain-containing sensor histidine kinase [Acidimicrobiia bacterium]
MTVTRTQIEKMLAERLEFLIGVGHDMRAPLTGIAGFAAVLAELDSVSCDPTAAEAVVYIRREASRLVELLNQLLDFGQLERAEGGQTVPPLELEALDLARLARQALEPWVVLNQQLSFELVSSGEVVIDGDFLKLHRVMANLLDNAVRHSPPGGSILIEVVGKDEVAELSVSDEGGGVPEGERRRIFERFVRLNGGGGHGAGIGLYIVKGLVAAHGGEVYVETAPAGSGARFVVVLPTRAGREPELPFEVSTGS